MVGVRKDRREAQSAAADESPLTHDRHFGGAASGEKRSTSVSEVSMSTAERSFDRTRERFASEAVNGHDVVEVKAFPWATLQSIERARHR